LQTNGQQLASNISPSIGIGETVLGLRQRRRSSLSFHLRVPVRFREPGRIRL